MTRFFMRCALPAMLFLCAAATAAGADEPLQPCRVAGIRNEVLCGSVTRPLDPARPEGTTIAVHYVVVPAMARRKPPDPVFLLAGGPGQSAIGVAPTMLPLFARLNNRRDIVFVDQRGTGRSAPLECEEPRHLPLAEQADSELRFARLMRCKNDLQKLPHGDLRFYTTPIAMQDLDAVRRQIGAERINLVGASYGTRAALDYQRQFPTHVRRSVIDGVAPPDMALPLSYSTDGQAAFDALLAACAADAACAKAHPALRADWATLLASLPKTVTMTHPLTGRTESFTLTRDLVVGAIRGPLYSPALASALPQALGEASRGRMEPIAGFASLFASRKGTAVSTGMHFSVVCAEDLPRMPPASGAAGGSNIGSDFAQVYRRVCAEWPRGDMPKAFYEMPASASPVLVLSGGADPVTPTRHGARVATALGRNAVHVVVPQAGHGVLGIACMRDVLFRFVDAEADGDALAVDVGCARNVPRPPAYRPIELSSQAPT
jgi:pimeloyl-ACP methyl ester carboxylesterase